MRNECQGDAEWMSGVRQFATQQSHKYALLGDGHYAWRISTQEQNEEALPRRKCL